MTLPNKFVFLRIGLTPVDISTDVEYLCPICLERPGEQEDNDAKEDAVHIAPCNHVIGRACIRKHVHGNGPYHNQCPLCRAVLFECGAAHHMTAMLEVPATDAPILRRILERRAAMLERDHVRQSVDARGRRNAFDATAEQEIYQQQMRRYDAEAPQEPPVIRQFPPPPPPERQPQNRRSPSVAQGSPSITLQHSPRHANRATEVGEQSSTPSSFGRQVQQPTVLVTPQISPSRINIPRRASIHEGPDFPSILRDSTMHFSQGFWDGDSERAEARPNQATRQAATSLSPSGTNGIVSGQRIPASALPPRSTLSSVSQELGDLSQFLQNGPARLNVSHSNVLTEARQRLDRIRRDLDDLLR